MVQWLQRRRGLPLNGGCGDGSTQENAVLGHTREKADAGYTKEKA